MCTLQLVIVRQQDQELVLKKPQYRMYSVLCAHYSWSLWDNRIRSWCWRNLSTGCTVYCVHITVCHCETTGSGAGVEETSVPYVERTVCTLQLVIVRQQDLVLVLKEPQYRMYSVLCAHYSCSLWDNRIWCRCWRNLSTVCTVYCVHITVGHCEATGSGAGGEETSVPNVQCIVCTLRSWSLWGNRIWCWCWRNLSTVCTVYRLSDTAVSAVTHN
jgi:hypothetical protein